MVFCLRRFGSTIYTPIKVQFPRIVPRVLRSHYSSNSIEDLPGSKAIDDVDKITKKLRSLLESEIEANAQIAELTQWNKKLLKHLSDPDLIRRGEIENLQTIVSIALRISKLQKKTP